MGPIKDGINFIATRASPINQIWYWISNYTASANRTYLSSNSALKIIISVNLVIGAAPSRRRIYSVVVVVKSSLVWLL